MVSAYVTFNYQVSETIYITANAHDNETTFVVPQASQSKVE